MYSYSLDSLAAFLHLAHQRRAGGALREASSAAAAATVQRDDLWGTLARLKEAGETVAVTVTGWNRGGLLVKWGAVPGFVPASQLGDGLALLDDAEREQLLSHREGEELTVKVIELNPARNRLVFSERAAAWAPQQGERLLAGLNVGDVRTGSVSNVCDFGVFVDLGGVDGLVHISEMSWGRVIHPARMMGMGDPVRVLVLSIDRARHHIGLSIKRLLDNPWAEADARYSVGDLLQAQVTHLTDFGAFVELEEGLEGLVHISELSDERIDHPADVLDVGQRVMVRVLRVEKEQHRLNLSIRQARWTEEDAGGDGSPQPSSDSAS